MTTLTDNQARLRDALPTPPATPASPTALAAATGLAYSTVTRLLRELAAAGAATKTDTGWLSNPTNPPHQKLEDTQLDDAEPDDTQPDDTDAEETDEPEDVEPEPEDDEDDEDEDEEVEPDGAERHTPAKARLGKGELREMVFEVLLQADEPLGPTAIAKRLPGKSSGAIANACHSLVNTGRATMTSESPRRFSITAAS